MMTFIFGLLSSKPATADGLSLTGGLGLAIQSDGNYSPLADVSLTTQRWKFNANISGYSESKTQVAHILGGLLYQIPITQNNRLTSEFGIGVLLAQTKVNSTSEKMVSLNVPLGLNWSIIRTTGFTLDANWKSWIFSIPSYIPPAALLSHDRFTTLALSAGVSL